jgi:1-deoxy-D-xylulose-5-phosphate synthase
VFADFDRIITVEDGCIQGGFGSAVLEFMADHHYHARVKRLGIPDAVIEQGTQPELWAECGYDTNAIVKAALELVDATQVIR